MNAPRYFLRFVDRIPEDGDPEGMWQIASDLAVEVISPTDIYTKVMNKVFDYLDEGVNQVWLIYPERKTADDLLFVDGIETLTENDL